MQVPDFAIKIHATPVAATGDRPIGANFLEFVREFRSSGAASTLWAYYFIAANGDAVNPGSDDRLEQTSRSPLFCFVVRFSVLQKSAIVTTRSYRCLAAVLFMRQPIHS